MDGYFKLLFCLEKVAVRTGAWAQRISLQSYETVKTPSASLSEPKHSGAVAAGPGARGPPSGSAGCSQ